MSRVSADILRMCLKGLALSTLLGTATTAAAEGLLSFDEETRVISETIKCPSPKLTKTEGLPDLWGCILPGAEVVKVFVNADEGNSTVADVKIMWNDWTRDIGYGVYTDKSIAEAWVAALATRYAPNNVQDVLEAFRQNKDVDIQGNGVILKYTYFKGPSIDERLITVSR